MYNHETYSQKNTLLNNVSNPQHSIFHDFFIKNKVHFFSDCYKALWVTLRSHMCYVLSSQGLWVWALSMAEYCFCKSHLKTCIQMDIHTKSHDLIWSLLWVELTHFTGLSAASAELAARSPSLILPVLPLSMSENKKCIS